MRSAPLATAAIAAALAVAGCGGDDSNQALSYDAFGAAANDICNRIDSSIGPLASQLKGDAAKDAPLYDDIVPTLEAATDDIKALDPPEELQASFTEYSDLVDQQLAGTKDAAEAAEAGDQQEYQRLLETIDSQADEIELAASKLGAADCIG
jgi:hypothetical protein